MNVTVLISAGVAVILLLAVSIILFVIMYQQRIIAHHLEVKEINEKKELELIQASIQSEEEERMRIAAELHDDVGATLASARLFLYKEKNTLYDENIINQSKELLDESINKIRNISHKLQPATLQHLGLELSLQSLIETVNKSGVITAKHYVKSSLPRVADNAELAAYRISQEIIANILKHSKATDISLEIGNIDTGIAITFMHNGTGLTQEMYEELIFKKGATGLKNIVNRLKSIKGQLHFSRIGDNSYQTVLTIPFNIENQS